MMYGYFENNSHYTGEEFQDMAYRGTIIVSVYDDRLEAYRMYEFPVTAGTRAVIEALDEELYYRIYVKNGCVYIDKAEEDSDYEGCNNLIIAARKFEKLSDAFGELADLFGDYD